MPLDNFRPTETPESRTYRVVLLLIVIGVIMALGRGLWQFLVGAAFGVELIALAAVAAIAYAVARYLRQQRT